MIFRECRLRGAFLIELEPVEDERGSFARTFCAREFRAHGLSERVVQCNVSFNRRRGTLRGMHFQRPPHEEAKLVRCVAGAIHDVILDLRSGSATSGEWEAFELSAANRLSLYVPEGFAHGFQTLQDDSEVHYLMSEFYSPEHAAGVRFDDPAFGLRWPLAAPIVSARDRAYPLYRR